MVMRIKVLAGGYWILDDEGDGVMPARAESVLRLMEIARWVSTSSETSGEITASWEFI